MLYLIGFVAGILFGVKYYLKRLPFTEEEIQRVIEMGEEPPKSKNPNRKIRPRKKTEFNYRVNSFRVCCICINTSTCYIFIIRRLSFRNWILNRRI